MTFPAILQAGKLRPREGSDLSETRARSRAGARNPMCVNLIDFSYLASPLKAVGCVTNSLCKLPLDFFGED